MTNTNKTTESRMDRRTLNRAFGAAAAFAAIQQAHGEQTMAQTESTTPAPASTVGMLLYPKFTALDLIGPQLLLSFLPGRTVHLLWKNREVVVSDSGVPIQPTMTFAEAPPELEFLFVPGGSDGTVAAMEDGEILDFVADRGARATYVTSVCTGSLVLGAAGLLNGYRATSHWSARDLLPLFGAEPVAERVVEDRNRITGGGVTAGIDFGLTLLARLEGEEYAQIGQLAIEYDPQPPFRSGTPEQAEPTVTAHMNEMYVPFIAAAREAIRRSPGYSLG